MHNICTYVHDLKSYYLKSNNLNTEEQPAIVPKKGSKDSLADGHPDGFYVSVLDWHFFRGRSHSFASILFNASILFLKLGRIIVLKITAYSAEMVTPSQTSGTEASHCPQSNFVSNCIQMQIIRHGIGRTKYCLTKADYF